MSTLDQVRLTNPLPPEALDRLRSPELDAALAALREDILASDHRQISLEAEVADRRSPSRRWLAAAAVLVVAVGAGATIGLLAQRNEPVSTHAPGGVAPHYLLDGWQVTNASTGNPPGGGSVAFEDGGHTFSVGWLPGDLLEQEVQAQTGGFYERLDDVDVDGARAAVFASPGRTEWIALWSVDGLTMTATQLDVPDEAAALEALAALRLVPEGEWRAAVAPTAVEPEEVTAVVDRLLVGVPLPVGFELEGYQTMDLTDERQIALGLAQDVTCGWFSAWYEARRAGDPAAEQAAVEVLEGHQRWPFVQALDEMGDNADVIQSLIGSMKGETGFAAGVETIEELYAAGWGAEGTCPLTVG